MFTPDRLAYQRRSSAAGTIVGTGRTWLLLLFALLIFAFALPALAADGATVSATAAATLAPSEQGRLLDGLFYGVMVGLMIYALIMFLTFGDRVYFYFLMACIWTLWTLALLSGDLARHVLADWPTVAERMRTFVPAVWGAFGLWFGSQFLQMERHVPRVRRITLVLAAACALAAMAGLAGVQTIPLAVVALSTLAGLVLCPLSLRPSRNHGYRISGGYLIGSVMILATTLAIVLVQLDWLPGWVTNYKLVRWATVGQAMIDSLALGQRLPRMQMQHDKLHNRAAEMALAAQTDPLTRVANRAGLAQRAIELLNPARKSALVMLDLDHFKPINDQYGHDIGDEVLMRVARRLERLSAPDDVVARLGGDEFAILRTNDPDRDDLALFARQVLDVVAAPIELHGKKHKVGASVGIAQYPQNGEDLSRLMRRADLALYRVKRRGRDGFAFFDDLPPNTSTYSNL